MAEPFATLSSQNHYHGDGATTVWNFTFADGYIDRSFVRAYTRNAAGDRTEIALTDANFMSTFTLQILPAVPIGTDLVIYRATEKRYPLVDFVDTGRITEQSLDTMARQSVHLAAEMSDYVGTGSEGDLVELATAAALASAEAVAAAAQAAASEGTVVASAAAASASAAAANASALAAAASAGNAAAAVAAAVSAALASLGTITVFADGTTDNRPALVAALNAKRSIAHAGNVPWVISTPLTFTQPIQDTYKQVFRTQDVVTLAAQPFFRPEWFGLGVDGPVMRAVNATPSQGGLIIAMNARYPRSYHTTTPDKILANTCVAGVDYLSKAGITIVGAGVPQFKSDNTELIEGTGTIFDGPFYVFADNFHASGFGVDSGSVAVARNWAGAPQDAFDFSRPNHNPEAPKVNVRIGQLVGLCASTTGAGHAVLLEGIQGLHVDFVEGRLAIHDVVFKSQDFYAKHVIGRRSSAENCIIKSDSYGVAARGRIDLVECYGGPSALNRDPGYGLYIDAVSADAGSFSVGCVRSYYNQNGVGVHVTNGFNMGSVVFDEIEADGCAQSYYLSNDVRGVVCKFLRAYNTTYAARVDANCTHKSNSIQKILAQNCTDIVNCDGSIDAGDVTGINVTGYAFNHTTGASRIKWSSLTTVAPFANYWQSTATLTGTWNGSGYRLIPTNTGRIRLEGTVSGGANGTVCAGVSVQLRPAVTKTFLCPTATNTLAVVQLDTAGVITVLNWASGMSVKLDMEWDVPY